MVFGWVAPRKNSDILSPKVIEEVSRLSHFGTRIATFTVSEQVQRDLNAAGFQMERVSGFGSKRECLRGKFVGENAKSNLPPYFELQRPIATSSRIAIIGGGIAAHTAAVYNSRARLDVLVISAVTPLDQLTMTTLVENYPGFSKESWVRS